MIADKIMHSIHRGAAALLTKTPYARQCNAILAGIAPAPSLPVRRLCHNPYQHAFASSMKGRHLPQSSDRWSAARTHVCAAKVEDAPAANVGSSRQYPDEPRVNVQNPLVYEQYESPFDNCRHCSQDPRRDASCAQVGIGVVVLRRAKGSDAAEVLLVRRAKAPEVGKWTFPGGSLELGGPICLPLTFPLILHMKQQVAPIQP